MLLPEAAPTWCIKQHEGSNIPVTLQPVWSDSRLDHKTSVLHMGGFTAVLMKEKAETGLPVHAPQNKILTVLSKHTVAETRGSFHTASFSSHYMNTLLLTGAVLCYYFMQCWRRRWQHGKVGMNSLRKVFWRWWNKVSKNSSSFFNQSIFQDIRKHKIAKEET